MGSSLTRHDAWADTNYILNLTESIIGKKTLAKLIADPLSARDGHAMRLVFHERIMTKVRQMSGEVLGKIVAYGGPDGLHAGPPCYADFLSMTGYRQVMNWTLDPSQTDGRTIMEALALFTIVCVARDIILQSVWQEESRSQLAEDEELDRGMRDYIHGAHRR